MAMVRFKASPLPDPPKEYNPQYVRELIRVLENYHSQLDSLTPCQAQSYTADFFAGVLRAKNYTTAEKNALVPSAGWVVFDTTLKKLCVYSGTAWETITSV